MTGSALAPIIIAIVAVLALAVWLAMVFYADAHPSTGPAAPAARPWRARLHLVLTR